MSEKKKLKKMINNLKKKSERELDAEVNLLTDKIKSLEEKIRFIDERTMALDSVKVNQILNKTVEAACIQNVYNRMANRGATREELDSFRNLIHKYNALEYTANKEDNGND